MSFYHGRRALVGGGRESPRGTDKSPDYWFQVIDHNLNPSADYARDESAYGRIEGVAGAEVIRTYAKPFVHGQVYSKSFPLIMLTAFGNVVTTADSPEDDANTHTFAVAQSNEHPSLSLTFANPAGNQRVNLAMLKSLDLDILADDCVEFKAEFESKSPVPISAPAVATIEDAKFTPRKATVKLADTVAGLDAAQKIDIISANMTIEKGTTRHYSIGALDPDAITNGTFVVSGELQLRLTDLTYQGYHLEGVKKALRITLEDSDTLIGEESHPLIEFELARVSFEEYDPSFAKNEVMTQSVGFIAEYSIADGKMISARVVNDATSY